MATPTQFLLGDNNNKLEPQQSASARCRAAVLTHITCAAVEHNTASARLSRCATYISLIFDKDIACELGLDHDNKGLRLVFKASQENAICEWEDLA